ncbi:50S ribosomal protein L11 [Limisalsivibrio acetivorans]|uniref:50S ribosomal protein L11 n=1 Tax=Limisalsivibrio acetivorans TaxID=1304888 RepID=UPI0003B59F8F|nr:50S ribosomal protein L11 [Limisalsivibrio acetivorans]
MAKKVSGQLKLQIPAGKANPSPPVGPALGQRGINIMEFCKAFNAATQNVGDFKVPVIITVYEDRSFTFITKTPPVSELIMKEIKLSKGSSSPKAEKVGKLNREQIERIAEVKMPDLNTKEMEQAIKIVAGSARSMGVQVEL